MECGSRLSFFCKEVDCWSLRPFHWSGNPVSFQANTWDQGKEGRSCQHCELAVRWGKTVSTHSFCIFPFQSFFAFQHFYVWGKQYALWPIKYKISLLWLPTEQWFLKHNVKRSLWYYSQAWSVYKHIPNNFSARMCKMRRYMKWLHTNVLRARIDTLYF